MPPRLMGRAAPAVLILSLTVNAIFVSCAADAVAPPVQDAGDAEILAALAAINTRLDSIDQRTRKIDDISVTAAESIVTVLSDPDADFMHNLVDAIELSAEVRAEVCAELSGGYGGEVTSRLNGEGGAHAEGGPNVVEAELQAKVQARLEAEFEISSKLEGEITGSICAGAGAELASDLPAAAEAMRAALGRLGIDGSRMNSLIASLDPPSTASFDANVSSVRSTLSLPSALTNVFDNPASVITSSPELADMAEALRCDSSLYPSGVFRDIQSRLCNLQVPSAETYLAILDGLDGLPLSVSSMEASLGTVCNAVNAMPRSIDINQVNVTILQTSYTVFPGYHKALFPGVSPFTC